MDNDIIKLLGIKDSNIKVLSVKESTKAISITIEREIYNHYCPYCQCRMYSKGIYHRKVNHPVMQGGLPLVLEINQRRWQCCNPECREIETDHFSFVDKHRRNTNISDLLIVKAFKEPTASARDIARRFSVSDTHAITTFEKYIDMPRRQLTEIICIDEVHLGISKQCNYALIIQDFFTGEPIDMVLNRREEITEPYFAGITLKERVNVKYIVSDMYRPYLLYSKKYFPNATSVVDAFHVIQLINRHFLSYIRKVIREIDKKEREEHERREQAFHRTLPFNHSKDYLVLKKYSWMLLKNRSSLKIYSQPKMNFKLGRRMNTLDYFDWMYRIDTSLKERYNLKEEYIRFNQKYIGNPKGARKGLKEIIIIYRSSKYKMFRDIANTLDEFFEQIIQSFTIVDRVGNNGTFESRLSNGPMESLNRIPKDLKRIGRGYRNFEHIRNRFLYSKRKNAAILSTPKRLTEAHIKATKNHITE